MSSIFTASRTICVASADMPALLGRPALEFKLLDSTTEAGPKAQALITALGETIARLAAARDLHERLSQATQEAKAHVHKRPE